MHMHNLTVPFENGNANRSVQNETEWNRNGLVAFTLHHGTVLERLERLFLASGNWVLATATSIIIMNVIRCSMNIIRSAWKKILRGLE